MCFSSLLLLFRIENRPKKGNIWRKSTFFGRMASSSNDVNITWNSSCASCSSGGITHPWACNTRNTAPGEYGSERNVGCVPFITRRWIVKFTHWVVIYATGWKRTIVIVMSMSYKPSNVFSSEPIKLFLSDAPCNCSQAMNCGHAASACNIVFKKHVRPKLCKPAICPRRCRKRDDPA